MNTLTTPLHFNERVFQAPVGATRFGTGARRTNGDQEEGMDTDTAITVGNNINWAWKKGIIPIGFFVITQLLQCAQSVGTNAVVNGGKPKTEHVNLGWYNQFNVGAWNMVQTFVGAGANAVMGGEKEEEKADPDSQEPSNPPSNY